jgi:hypothetical protein
MSISSIRVAIRSVQVAKRRLEDEVAETFPIGADISWERGGHRQHGTVLHHGHHGNVRVRNDRTKTEYWIGMYDVVGYVSAREAA